ncbi:hypothetical protein HNR42_002231 [Deinobacterium chartae]|uniref:Uncharacterized protein n=1 Tax=Deinobacterium chartae TaxID=521158 RepID=A0A841I138_9DEIO|nr:hypothetical protein [Deinobacterium chartae]MBB6098796.1 hypothetical protein [Deinobacterium chartae]
MRKFVLTALLFGGVALAQTAPATDSSSELRDLQRRARELTLQNSVKSEDRAAVQNWLGAREKLREQARDLHLQTLRALVAALEAGKDPRTARQEAEKATETARNDLRKATEDLRNQQRDLVRKYPELARELNGWGDRWVRREYVFRTPGMRGFGVFEHPRMNDLRRDFGRLEGDRMLRELRDLHEHIERFFDKNLRHSRPFGHGPRY